MKKRLMIGLVVCLVFSLTIVTTALAGASFDVGNVTGFPAAGTVNWTAWHSGSMAGSFPQQVMTEDSTNSSSGVDQGYSTFGGKMRWILIVSNFDTPPAVSGSSTVTVLLGGLGVESGNLWSSSFVWDNSTSTTDHGAASTFVGTAPCPTVTSATASGGNQTINWSGPDGTYHVYRSQNASGAGNGASNGRYDFVGSATAAGGTGTYTDSTATQSWYIVIHADAGGAIDGCHSEEAAPTAVDLVSFTASPNYSGPSVTLGFDTLNEVNVSGYNVYRALTLDGIPEKINTQLIQAQHPGEILGGHYDITDATIQRGSTYFYYIEIIPLNGESYQSRPLKVMVGYPTYLPFISH